MYRKLNGAEAPVPGLFAGPVSCRLGGQIGVDKAVQVSVHDAVDVAGFIGGAVVLHQLVGHEYVGTDLAAPLNKNCPVIRAGL